MSQVRFWRTAVLSLAIFMAGLPSIRKARADELSFYWATIPFDIEEPLFVVDTNSERFIVHLLNKQPKITLFWIELVGDLRTLKNK